MAHLSFLTKASPMPPWICTSTIFATLRLIKGEIALYVKKKSEHNSTTIKHPLWRKLLKVRRGSVEANRS